ncbi:hypothetical protein OROHE_016719 [Orobanche hederae]
MGGETLYNRQRRDEWEERSSNDERQTKERRLAEQHRRNNIQLMGVENVPPMLRCTTLEVDFKSVTGPIANLYPFTRAVMMRLYLWSGG